MGLGRCPLCLPLRCRGVRRPATAACVVMSVSQGFLISLEGIEGGGKSTHLEFVAQWLRDRGREVVTSREPGGTALGEQIRRVLLCPESEGMHLDAELLLLFAARAQHFHERILPAIESGKAVVSDRFIDASLAYQGAGRGATTQRIQALQAWTLDAFCPRLTLLFDVEPTLGLSRAAQRGVPDRFEREPIEFYDRVRECYRSLAEQEPHRFRVLNANLELQRVRDDLARVLSEFLS